MPKKAQAGDILNNSRAAQATQAILEQVKEDAPAKKTAKKTGRPKTRTEDYVRLCVAIPGETKRQLEEAAFARSTPGKICTLTQLIIELAAEEEKRRNRRKN